MWECIEIAWRYFAGVLNPLGMILLLMLIWSEVKAFLMRRRVAVVLDRKDAYTSKLTEKVLAMAEGYSKLTGLLEEIVSRQRRRNEVSH